MTTKEVAGTYGLLQKQNRTIVYVAENNNGSKWYVQEGGTIVNKTYDPIEEGVNIEELSDVDCFTWDKPIESLEELVAAIEA